MLGGARGAQVGATRVRIRTPPPLHPPCPSHACPARLIGSSRRPARPPIRSCSCTPMPVVPEVLGGARGARVGATRVRTRTPLPLHPPCPSHALVHARPVRLIRSSRPPPACPSALAHAACGRVRRARRYPACSGGGNTAAYLYPPSPPSPYALPTSRSPHPLFFPPPPCNAPHTHWLSAVCVCR